MRDYQRAYRRGAYGVRGSSTSRSDSLCEGIVRRIGHTTWRDVEALTPSLPPVAGHYGILSYRGEIGLKPAAIRGGDVPPHNLGVCANEKIRERQSRRRESGLRQTPLP